MPPGESDAAKYTGWRVNLVVTALLLIGGVAGYSAATWESPTSDEPLHAAAGYVIRFMDDYRVDPEDPALFPLISSVAQSADDLRVDPRDKRFSGIFDGHDWQWQLTVKMMFRTPKPDGHSLYSGGDYINRARIVFTVISAILGGLLSRWAYELAGPAAAIVAAGLYAFDPNFLAHGPLVKNDVPISLAMLWLLYGTWKLGERATPLRMLSVALACGIGVNVKFSGLVFGPLLAMALVIRAIDAREWTVLHTVLKSRAARVGFVAIFCLGVGLFCWASIWTVYRWRFSAGPDPSSCFTGRNFVEAKGNAPLAAILWLDDHKLLPDAWLYGFTYTYGSTSEARDGFLLGMHSQKGWWYYFPLAMLFKTPIAVIAGAALLAGRRAIALIRDRQFGKPSWSAICLWLPIVVYGTIAMRTHLNLGLRHILPVYPFIFILMSVALARWMSIAKRGARVIAVTIVAGAAIESLIAWPHEIAFFNFAAGGARGGIRLLSDSNLDWGQDLPLLADWHQQHRDVPLYLAYFGTTDPHFYGIDYLHLPGGYHYPDVPVATKSVPGVMAVSATYLQNVYTDGQLDRHLAFLRTQKPREIFGGSIYLYDWNPDAFADYLAKNPD